jgi:soluble lytic murein transglycosylase-like protein
MRVSALVAALFFAATNARAGDVVAELSARPDCLEDAANYFSVPVPLARAIAMHESGMRADAVNRNKDGSRDIGIMQINSSWLPKLRKYNITERDLFQPCVNEYVGNWILAGNIERLGFNWDAVGAFNAASPEKRATYAKHIYKQLMAIQDNPPAFASRR